MAGESVGVNGQASRQGSVPLRPSHQPLWAQLFFASLNFSASQSLTPPYTLFNTPATPLPLVRATLAGFSFLGAS